jgi:mRNA-degrading endonuclease RelE of RelBE toxin-antitoxin system
LARHRPHRVELTSPAKRDVKRLRAHAARILAELAVLETDPFAGEAKTGSLKGVRAVAFPLPGGEYRAAYAIHPTEPVCIVFMVGPRENFYSKAARRWEGLQT